MILLRIKYSKLSKKGHQISNEKFTHPIFPYGKNKSGQRTRPIGVILAPKLLKIWTKQLVLCFLWWQTLSRQTVEVKRKNFRPPWHYHSIRLGWSYSVYNPLKNMQVCNNYDIKSGDILKMEGNFLSRICKRVKLVLNWIPVHSWKASILFASFHRLGAESRLKSNFLSKLKICHIKIFFESIGILIRKSFRENYAFRSKSVVFKAQKFKSALAYASISLKRAGHFKSFISKNPIFAEKWSNTKRFIERKPLRMIEQ